MVSSSYHLGAVVDVIKILVVSALMIVLMWLAHEQNVVVSNNHLDETTLSSFWWS